MILRSRTPEGVYQEAWGYLCVHYALRALIHAAADHGDLDPDRISFARALHAARRGVRTGLDATVTLAVALHRATGDRCFISGLTMITAMEVPAKGATLRSPSMRGPRTPMSTGGRAGQRQSHQFAWARAH